MKTEEVERLRDRVEELEDLLGLKYAAPDCLQLTETHRKMLGLLINRALVSRAMFFAAIYGDRPETRHPDNDMVVDVHLVAIRRKLREHNIAVQSRYGVGWYIGPQDKARLKRLTQEAA